ncbi:16S rRNA C967 or C1407 C5-methylase (RsmB/RsmF family) [Mucilaginibacter yixingensis]|uniref:16S rRNA C967 or C1407 C5-methylase (RsmB/RsmF family) n=1 Tax=Mucilaginibacter yixingensis TaxID=1295612 RepID=A0A2T5J576_9SPHI|nr:RNA methyltransferase [Mucilaginibacter yixingensis]PTQ93129.1 16S rRNA C967 or C1407 C5-methylase (RsmB/RsmF family) [Mucilaginibacter yixingensis]
MSDIVFPGKFIESISNAPGFDAQNFVETHQNLPAPTSIRINPSKYSGQQPGVEVPWCPEGFYLESRPSFTFDPLFHAGCYYVQEASSMFITHIYNSIRGEMDEPIRALDLCAAPGGKSTLLSSALNQDDLLVANEIIKTRVPILTDNLTRWGRSNTIVTNNDPRDYGRVKGFFDLILVDAPCSGSGMFRKEPEAMQEWSVDNVNLCQQRQERILADVYPALREDGYLIYSTCSYSEQENEQVLDWLCTEFGMESVRIPVEQDWGVVESQSTEHKAWGYRFYPGKVQGEGLFAACLRKTESSGETKAFKKKDQGKPDYKSIDLLKPYIKEPANYYFFKLNDDWLAIDKIHREDLETLQQYLYIKKSGVRLGSLAGKDLVPDHELAMSLMLDRDQIQQTELSREQAISYLRRDEIKDLDLSQKGWNLMCFEGHPLGWAKLLPNRVNNYYPKEMRILSTGS